MVARIIMSYDDPASSTTCTTAPTATSEEPKKITCSTAAAATSSIGAGAITVAASEPFRPLEATRGGLVGASRAWLHPFRRVDGDGVEGVFDAAAEEGEEVLFLRFGVQLGASSRCTGGGPRG